MQKNEVYENIAITDLNNLGCGICRIGGKAVFVNGAVDGDTVTVRIIKDCADYAVGRAESLTVPSPHRIKSGCPFSKRCGGCVYRSITYKHELELKRGYVENAFRKAGLSVKVNDVTALSDSGYRNKVQYPVGKDMRAGFFASHSHEVIPVDGCLLEDPRLHPVAGFCTAFLAAHGVAAYDEKTGAGLLRHIYLRIASSTGEIMVTLVMNGERLACEKEFTAALVAAHPEVVTVLLNINRASTNVILGSTYRILYGRGYIEDRLGSLTFRISAPSFWQVNSKMTERLYAKVSELAALSEGELLCDLFCGIGSIGLSVIAGVPSASLLGVEVVPEAVRNAEENALLNGMKNARFICGDANSEELENADVIIADPPRRGLEPELINRIAGLSPRSFIYVSCNPDTLARDAAALSRLGYSAREVFTFDLFPRTGHVESVVSFKRDAQSG